MEKLNDLKTGLRYILFIYCCLQATRLSAQANVEKYTTPAEFQLFENLVQYKGEQGIGYDVCGNFYPIGWSKNGKLAYVKTYNYDPSDVFGISLMVYDIATNQAKTHWNYETAGSDTVIYNGGLPAVWKRWNSIFIKELNSLGIKQSLNWKPLEQDSLFEGTYSVAPDSDEIHYQVPYLPYSLALETSTIPRQLKFTYAKKDFIISVSTITGKQKSGFNTKPIAAYSFFLKSGKQLIKQTPRINADPDDLISIDLLHAFVDPLGNRIIFVYRKYSVGFEGPPNRNDFEIGGFDLGKQ